jgi:hypothetical protein
MMYACSTSALSITSELIVAIQENVIAEPSTVSDENPLPPLNSNGYAFRYERVGMIPDELHDL